MVYNMVRNVVVLFTLYITLVLSSSLSCISLSLFQPSSKLLISKKITCNNSFKTMKMVVSSSDSRQIIQSNVSVDQKVEKSSTVSPQQSPPLQPLTTPLSTPRNLKTLPVKEDRKLLSKWNELKGLSEKELIISSSSSILKDEREDIALTLAYKRCEYVTQLFSKTFYMGTSLMRPDARAHVWAIYAW